MKAKDRKRTVARKSHKTARPESLEPRHLLAAADLIQTFEEVRNTVEVEFYHGLMKGPAATLETSRGNAWDQAALLDQQLDGVLGDSISSQIVIGRVSGSSSDVQQWIGAQDHVSAMAILTTAKLTPDDSVSGQIAFDHSWVQVTTPELNGGNSFYLDPSWKTVQRQSGIELDAIDVSGTTLANYDSAFRFDEADYISAERPESAFEYFVASVSDQLAEAMPGTSIAEVPRTGTIVREGYQPDSVMTSTSGYSVESVVDLFDDISDPDLDIHKHKARIALKLYHHPYVPPQVIDPPTEPTLSAIVLDVSLPDQGLDTLTVDWELVQFSYQNTYLAAVVYVNGVAQEAEQFSFQAEDVDDFELRITQAEPGQDLDTIGGDCTAAHVTCFDQTRGVGVAIGFDALQHSHSSLDALRSDINNTGTPEAAIRSTTAYSLAKYWHDFTDQAKRTSELFHAIDVRPQVGVGIAEASGGYTYRPDLIFPYVPNKFAVDLPGGVVAPVRTKQWTAPAGALAGQDSFSDLIDRRALEVIAYNGSALEHILIEEVANSDSVSTAKGLQESDTSDTSTSSVTLEDHVIFQRPDGDYAVADVGEYDPFRHHRFGNNIYDSDTSTWHTIGDLTTSTYTESELSSFLLATSQTTTPSWIKHTSQTVDRVVDLLDDGFSVAIPNLQNRYYDPNGFLKWDGSVYFATQITSSSFTVLLSIDDGAVSNGGHSLWLADPYTLPPQSEFVFAGDPIDVTTGNVFREEVDIQLPSKGVPLALRRRYDSVNDSASAGFGKGWTHNYADKLVFLNSNTKIQWTASDGRTHVFEWDGGSGSWNHPDTIFGTIYGGQNDTTYFFKTRDGMSYEFERIGDEARLKSLRDRNGHGIEVSYNGSIIERVEDSEDANRWIKFSWSNTDYIWKVEDHTGREWLYTQSSPLGHPQLDSVTYPQVPVHGVFDTPQVSYDYYQTGYAAGLMEKITEADGGWHRYEYYGNKQGFRVTEGIEGAEGAPGGITSSHSFTYYPYRRETAFVDERGNETLYRFDDEGRVTRQRYEDLTSDIYGFENTRPRLNKQKTSWTNQRGVTETYVFQDNDLGNLDYSISTDGLKTSYEYESAPSNPHIENVKTITVNSDAPPAEQRITEFTYDQFGRLTHTKNAEGQFSRIDYGPFTATGQTVYTTSPKGVDATGALLQPLASNEFTTETRFDATGQPTESLRFIDGSWITLQTNSYTNRGFLDSTIDAYGQLTDFGYDALGRTQTQALPDPDGPSGPKISPKTLWEYDALGRIVKETDPKNNVSLTTYDLKGRVTNSTDPESGVTASSYDGAGNRISVTDHLSRTTEFVYDSQNRVVQTVFADGSRSFTQYDGGGNILASIDGLGNETRTTFDEAGRTLTVTNAKAEQTRVEYNEFGDPIGQYDVANNKTSMNVDKLGRPVKTISPAALNLTTETVYDANGNVVSSSAYPSDAGANSPDRRTTETRYDNLDRPVESIGTATLINEATAGSINADSLLSEWDAEYDGDAYKWNVTATGELNATQWNPLIYGVAPSSEYYEIQTTFQRSQTNPRPQLVVRYQDDGNFTVVHFSETQLEIQNFVAGQGQPAATTSYGPGTTLPVNEYVQLSVSVDGDDISVHVNGSSISEYAEATLAGFANIGRVGLIVAGSDRQDLTFRDFSLLERPVVSTSYDVGDRITSSTDAEGKTSSYEYDALGRQTLAVSPAETLVHDDFYRDDDFLLSNLWSGDESKWGLLNTQLKRESSGWTMLHLEEQPQSMHYSVSVDYETADYLAEYPQLIARHQDSGDFSLLKVSRLDATHQRVTIETWVNGQVSSGNTHYVDVASLPEGQMHNLKLRIDGSRLSAYANDELLIQETHAAFADPGGMALAVAGSGSRGNLVFDNAVLEEHTATTNDYDANSNVISTTDSLGRTTTFEFDGLNRVTKVTQPGGITSETVYDAVGNIVATIDPLGRQSTTSYDTLNRVSSALSPAVDVFRDDFTGSGNIVAQGNWSVQHGPDSWQLYNGNKLILNSLSYGRLELTEQPESNFYDVSVKVMTPGLDIARPQIFARMQNVSEYSYADVYESNGSVFFRITTTKNGQTVDTVSDPYPLTTFAANVEHTLGLAVRGDDLTVYLELSDGTRTNMVEATHDGFGNPGSVGLAVVGSAEWQLQFDDFYLGQYAHTATTYDQTGNMATVTDPLGRVTAYSYDELNRPISVDAYGRTTQTSYDQFGNVDTVTDFLGRATDFDYDAFGRLLTSKLTAVSTGQIQSQAVTTNQYDAFGNLLSTTDAEGNTTSYVYDRSGRTTAVLPPLVNGEQAILRTTYDLVGNVATSTDGLGRTSAMEFDNRERAVMNLSPGKALADEDFEAGSAISDAFEGATNNWEIYNNRIRNNGGYGQITLKEKPTSEHYRLETTVRMGDLVSARPQLFARHKSSSEFLLVYLHKDAGTGQSTMYLEERLPDGSGVKYTRKSLPVVVNDNEDHRLSIEVSGDSIVARLGSEYEIRATHSGYDGPGVAGIAVAGTNKETVLFDDVRLIEFANTKTDYDSVGNSIRVIDAIGNRTEYLYDDLNRLVSESNRFTSSNPNGETRSYSYNAASELTDVTDRDGVQTRYEYDTWGQRIAESWAPDGSSAYQNEASWSYDIVGRPTNVSNDLVNEAYTYDDRDRLANRTVGITNGPSVTFTFSYDDLNNEYTRTDTTGNEYTYRYDERDRLYETEFRGTGSETVSFDYDQLGNVTNQASGAVSTTFARDDWYRLDSIFHVRSGTTDQFFHDVNYDLASQVVSKSLDSDPARIYSYDELGQLRSTTVAGQPVFEQSYDANGNRDSNGYVVGDNNQIASVNGDGLTYDELGRLTGDARTSWIYGWDHRSRLTSVASPVGPLLPGQLLIDLEYGYDTQGNRVHRHDGVGLNTSEYYIYDERGNLTHVFEGTQLERSFAYANGIDQVLAEWESSPSSNTRWLLTDHLGSVRHGVTSQGIDEVEYDDFGNIDSESYSSGYSGFTLAYAGRELDAGTGHYNNRARWYDPEDGRFLNQDPIGFGGGDANLYRYVGNSPTTYVDPSGLSRSNPVKELGLQRGAAARLLGNFESQLQDYRDSHWLPASFSAEGRHLSKQVQDQKRIVASFDQRLGQLDQSLYNNGTVNTIAGFSYGYQGGSEILTNTLTFGVSDRIGFTNSSQYQGGAFDIARASAMFGRESLVTAVTLGGSALVNGGRVAANTGRAARFFAAANSPLVHQTARVAAGSTFATRGIGAAHAGLTVYEGYQTLGSASASYDAFSNGNYGTGTFYAGLAGLGAIGFVDGFGIAPNTTLSRGAQLRQKYGHLSSAQRQARIAELGEANAARWLNNLEQANPGSHFLSRHGAATLDSDQAFRAMSGLRPDTPNMPLGQMRPGNASRFLSNRDQMHAIDRANRLFASGVEKPIVQFEYQIGEGYLKMFTNSVNGRKHAIPFGPHPFTSNAVQVYYRNGLPWTAFPTN